VSYQLGNAKVWDGTQWVEAVGDSGFLYGDTIDTSDPVTFTCDATAHVKGAWVEAVASTTSEANQLFLTVYNINVNGQATGTLIDVGIGAAGSEVVVAENIAVGGANLNDPRMQFPLFVNVPTNSRIAIRGQSVVAGGKTGVVVIQTAQGSQSPATVDVFGTDTSTSTGTTPGLNLAWNEIVASTTQNYAWFVAVFSGSAPVVGNTTTVLRIGTGAAGSESVVRSVTVRHNSAEAFGIPFFEPFTAQVFSGKNIPIGTRLAVSAVGSLAGAGVTLIGVPA
jgi:hypothetical protein